MIGHGRYKRWLYIDKGYKRVIANLPRYICKNCHETHVAFPPTIVPYKIHETATIQTVIDGKKEANKIAVENSTQEEWINWNEKELEPEAEIALARREALDAREGSSSLLSAFKAKYKLYLSRIVVIIYQEKKERTHIACVGCPP